jgi:rare lipoprotein A
MALAASTATPGAHIAASEDQVPYGKTVRLDGAVPGVQGANVQITFRGAGDHGWAPVSDVQTNSAGAYSTEVRPKSTGEWRAQPSEGQPSLAERIEVRSVINAKVRHNVRAGRRVEIGGRVRPAGSGRKVRIKVGGRSLGARTRHGGSFHASWRVPHAGRYKVRVKALGDARASTSNQRVRKVTAFRPAAASWYGPGLYGGHLACGGTLTPSRLGVAHRTMRCGTKLTLRYHGRSVDTRVIDRGPYAGNREFDLTAATKRKLGFPSTGTVLSSR